MRSGSPYDSSHSCSDCRPQEWLRGEELIREFAGQDYFDDLAMGVARTLERIGDADAHRELAVLADRQDLPGASHVARRALDK